MLFAHSNVPEDMRLENCVAFSRRLITYFASSRQSVRLINILTTLSPFRSRKRKAGAATKCESHNSLVFCRTGERIRVPEVVSLRRWCSVCRRTLPVPDRLLRSTRVQQMHSSRRFIAVLFNFTVTVLVA